MKDILLSKFSITAFGKQRTNSISRILEMVNMQKLNIMHAALLIRKSQLSFLLERLETYINTHTYFQQFFNRSKFFNKPHLCSLLRMGFISGIQE